MNSPRDEDDLRRFRSSGDDPGSSLASPRTRIPQGRGYHWPRYVPEEWDESLPYGGKVFLARRKKPDSFLCVLLQVSIVVSAFGFLYYGWYYTEHLHFHVTKAYAHISGHPHMQAMVGNILLNGNGVEKNHSAAMEWFKKAADQGHPEASYNIAVGHLQGIDVGLKPGDAHNLIKFAAKKGVNVASDVLERICSQGHCDN